LICKEYLVIPFLNSWLFLADDLFLTQEQVINFTNLEINLHFKGNNEDGEREVRQVLLNITNEGISLAAEL
jgi:hypothetical protein